MKANELRKAFLDFFESKQHNIVASAPMVVKNDPTLMFTNAGMNQFKDYFLGNSVPKSTRVTDSQKCLRVSGKHNDLEEVGHDTYHHTMFEMLGNWSFGDYFKQEAIDWAWEFLVDELGIDKERLYASVFEGSDDDGLKLDTEAQDLWLKYLPGNRVLNGSKKDNFWEMGDTGPCGPCSEVHVDIRSDEDRAKISGASLVNQDHPLVIEIWNLVFIQYNRKANGQLEALPNKHVDTGMGFERLAMVTQGKQSNYDTDVFQPLLQKIAALSEKKYGQNEQNDIAMRVIADHLRAVSFSIADGQLPSNNKAGYVIRRILRRAVRYAYTFLGANEPFIHLLVPTLVESMGNAFPELAKQQDIISKVILEEEQSFLRTLANGIKILDNIIAETKKAGKKNVSGDKSFVLYDTFGFPADLTDLILRENGLEFDHNGFTAEMAKQKERSRAVGSLQTDDWVVLEEAEAGEFTGYDQTEDEIKILRYRKISVKKKEMYQLVFSKTPFYAESGGQVGDTGYIEANGEKTTITDTKKENKLTVHFCTKLPSKPEATFKAVVNVQNRMDTENNHSATHLLHHALRNVLGTHVEQKGSYVDSERLRFDFSHFQKLTDEEIAEVEKSVNAQIRKNHTISEKRAVAMSEAEAMGAIAFFGEKYGDKVRVVKFGDSVELCGGTHVAATGQIGMFKITSEAAIASGIRRIEAITATKSEAYVNEFVEQAKEIKSLLKSSGSPIKAIRKLIEAHDVLNKQLGVFRKEKAAMLAQTLMHSAKEINGIQVICAKVVAQDAGEVKELAYKLGKMANNMFVVLGADLAGKANLTVLISEQLVANKGLNAGAIIREIAKEIQGGGGGQAFVAQAGGKKPEGIQNALDKAYKLINTHPVS